MTSKEQLQDLHGIVAEELKRRIASGEATAADLSAAIKFLKDNGIEYEPVPGDPTDLLDEADAQVDLPPGLKMHLGGKA